MRHRAGHDGLETRGRQGHGLPAVEAVIVNAEGHLLVDIVVVEGPWPTEGGAQIRVEVVGTPEGAFPALQVGEISSTGGRVDTGRASVDAEGQHQVSRCAEETPAVIEARMRQEIEALRKTGLNAGESNGALFSGKLLFRSGEEARAGSGVDGACFTLGVVLRMGEDHEEESRATPSGRLLAHGAARVVKLLEPALDCRAVEEAVGGGGEVEVAPQEALGLWTRREDKEAGVELGEGQVAKGEDGRVGGEGCGLALEFALDAEEEGCAGGWADVVALLVGLDWLGGVARGVGCG
jgi:hypothetical protein